MLDLFWILQLYNDSKNILTCSSLNYMLMVGKFIFFIDIVLFIVLLPQHLYTRYFDCHWLTKYVVYLCFRFSDVEKAGPSTSEDVAMPEYSSGQDDNLVFDPLDSEPVPLQPFIHQVGDILYCHPLILEHDLQWRFIHKVGDILNCHPLI